MSGYGDCRRHVTPDYMRVFASADGIVHGCPACGVSPPSASG